MELNTEKVVSKVTGSERYADEFRFERKFLIGNLSRPRVESIVLANKGLFREVFHTRQVNNIYFDSIDKSNFFDNVDGAAQRIKFRIRWYGDLMGAVEKPVLELKIKSGLLGTKRSFKLPPFNFDRNINKRSLEGLFQEADLPNSVKVQMSLQEATLVNYYRRKYFLSANKHYRITIDDQLSYYEIRPWHNTFAHVHREPNNVVLELKYDQQNSDGADFISNQFPFRMTKNSKYVTGVESYLF